MLYAYLFVVYLPCKTFIHRKYNKMATITTQQFSTKELKALISDMVLDNTLNSLQCYNKKMFINHEVLYKGEKEASIEICVTVATSYKNDKIVIKDVDISNVDLWKNDSNEVFVSDQMLLIIKKEITEKVKNLI